MLKKTAVKYKTDRTTDGSTIYADFGDQLDMLYADMKAGKLDTIWNVGYPHQSG